uniref:Ig-like domain-containing protein n=1 Tax=Winslowiella toletana TaxID=92490 RepID=UPI0028BE6ECF|nr:Ig-like domain-containing protein [Winslowiella toletana]
MTVTVGGREYTTTVNADLSWSLELGSDVLTALGNGGLTIGASVTNGVGNSGSGTRDVTVDANLPGLRIDTVAGDDVINVIEHGQNLIVTGSSSGLAAGSNLTVTIGAEYPATVLADGSWSAVPAADLAGGRTLAAGRRASTRWPVTVTPRAGGGPDPERSGNQRGGGRHGDRDRRRPRVHHHRQRRPDWSLELGSDVLTALGNGGLTIGASVTNGVGNSGSGTRDVTVDANLPGLRIDTVAGDDVINVIEHGQNLIVTGSSSGLAAGSNLTVTINGAEYPATVLADGSWSAAVPAADVGGWPAGSLTVTAAGESAAGNPVSISHGVTVDLAAVAITVGSVTADNVLNAAEKGQDLVLSGATANVEAGQPVTVTFGGRTYRTEVDADGNWSLTVPAADLAGLKDGDAVVQAGVSSVSGNAATAGREYSVDATAPSLTIGVISENNVLNAAEAGRDLTLSGTSTAEAGQTVTVTFNGREYSTEVLANGSWTLDVPAADLAGIADGVAGVTASVADKAGNPASASHNLTVDVTVPVVTINTVAGDDVINLAEHGQAQVISGSASGAAAGDRVTVTVGGQSYTTVLDAAGNWSVGLPAAAVSALQDGTETIAVSVTDAAGNTGGGTRDVSVDTGLPSLGFDAISGDNVLNAAEKGQDLTVSGTSSGLAENTAVTVTLNGKTYDATTAADGSWSLTVPAADLAALGEANYTLSATASSGVGNSVSAGAGLQVNTALPGVFINAVAGDDVINAAELAAGQTLSGRVTNAAEGDTVTVTVGGREYTTTVNADLSWSLELGSDVLTALGNGGLTIGASVTNGVGNSGSGTRDVTVDANLPGLRIDTVAGDDVINVIEHGQNLIVTGSSSGLAAGSNLTVTINGAEYPATVLADGSWSAAVPAADVGGWPAGSLTVTAAGESAAGNPVSISHGVTVDLAAVAITVGSVTADNVLNAAEKGQDLVLSGATANVEAGQPVTVTFGGRTYRTEVDADGNWSLTVPAADLAGLKDGDAVVQAGVSSVSGNAATAGREYSVDATAPSLTIGVISENNVLNAAEAGRDLTLSGTSTAEAGQTVTVTFNGREYSTEVLANGSWTLDVPAADLAGIADGVAGVTASVADKAGNPASASHNLTVDVTVPVVTINTVAGDDVINLAEHGQAQVISGSASGAAAGDRVTVTVGGQSYTTVLDAAGNWSVGLPAAAVSALQDGTETIAVSVTDAAGNTGGGTRDVSVDTGLPSLGFDAISGDNVLNAAEKGQDLTVSGTSSGLAENTAVTVTLNGKTYDATTAADGSWSLTVPAADLAALGEANYTLSATASSGVGNSVSAGAGLQVNTALPGVFINAVAGDDVINAAELAAGQTLSGRVTNAAEGDTVTVTVGGREYTTTVNADLSWSLELGSDVLTALGNGALTIGASVTNGVGNSGSGTRDVTVDANLPGLRIDTVAGDDVINVIEHGQNLIVTGSSSGLAAGSSLTVTINGAEYPATVLADGSWSAAVPAADVGGWPAGSLTVTAAGESAAGNPVSISHGVTVDLAAVAITVGSVTADNVLNAAEKGQDLVLSGATANVEAGQPVTVTFGGRTYRTEVDADGNWSLTVPAADLAGLKDGDAVVQAGVSSVSGNAATAGREYSVDATAPSLTIGVISENNVLNAAEAGRDLTLSGTSTAEAGQTVTVTFNGREYSTGVQADGSWTLDVPAADLAGIANGSASVTASVADKAGNPASTGSTLFVDTTVPVLTINTVAGDDVINAAEHGQAQIISGSVTGAQTGDVVTVTLGDKSYTTTLDASGNWSVGVSAADVSALNAGAYTITAALTDKAGNSNSAQHTVNVTLSSPELTINAIAIDDVINAAEKGADLVLSGTTTNVEAGQQVTLTFGGKTYSAEVGTNGSWSYTVPAADLAGLKNGDAVVQASVSNVSGNGVTAERGYTVDASTPTLTIDTISGDNMLNAAEAGQDLTLSGTSSAEAGQIVTVTFNGKDYSTEVLANGSWTLDVPAADMAEIADGTAIVTASVANQSGNPASASHNLTVDVTVPVVTINTVAGDDVINAVEHGQAQIISGSASGAAAGDVVTVTIGDNSWTTTLNAAGNWSVGIPAAAISALQDGTVTIGVSVTDAAGNTGGDTHNVTVETGVPSLGFDAISGDNVLNAVEKGQDLTVSGTSSGLAENTTVTVTLNGKNYEASTTANGSWTLTVPATDVANLVDGGSYSLSASAQSSAGNSAAATDSISVDTTAPVISIATLAGDNVLNAAEQQQPLTINGSTSAEAGQTVRVTLGEKTYETTVSSDGTWTLNVPASDLAELDEGALTVTASVNDKAGNNGQATHPLTVDTVAPTVTINTVAGDDIVNNSEQLAGQTVSGTSTAEQGQTVIVTFGDRNWQTTVDADGNWSVFIPGRDFLGLSDGGYEITASVSDKAGNPGSTSRDVTLSGEVPTITVDTFAGDDIVSAAEHGTPLVISGTTTAPVGERVTITLNDKTYTTTVQEGGRWSYTVGSADVTALADGGAYVINAQVSNAIGNSASDDRTVTVELAAPSMGISIDSLQNDTGLSATDFITNDSQVVVQGSLTAQLGNNEKAQISLDGGVSWIDLTVTATNWSYSDSRTLTDGSYTYQVRVVDNAGNVGATDSQIVVVDLTAPVAPTITVDAITQDTGLSDSDFITSDNQITLSGTLGAGLGNGDHAQISIDGGVTWTDVNVSGLKWTYVDGRTLQDGDYNYQLRVIDDAGNISATTNQVVTIDTTGPAASKTVSIDSISDDTGLSNSDFITNDTSLTLHGSLGATLAADEFVQISLDGGNSWQNVTVIGTNWNFTDGRTLENQTYNYWVRVVDTAGNVGATAQQQVTVDTIAPDAAITVSVDNITVDTGFDNNDFLTSATSYTLHGTLGAGLGANEFVQVSMDGGTTWVYATVDGTSWSYTDARTLTDGAYNYQVRVVDVAGNVGATTSQRVTVDTEAPQYGITVDAISEDTGQSDSDFITNDTSLTVSGSIGSTLASDERVQISLDGGTTWVDATVTNRSWSYTDTRELTDGDYTYQVRIIDQAGNVGSTAQQVVTVDTTPPSTQGTVVSYTDETGERQGDFGASVATDDTSPVINGSLNQALADGEIAELYRDGVLLGQVTMNGATSWYFQDSSLRDGNHTYVMRITDTAGNYTDSDDFVLKVDTSVPTTTAVITAQTTTDTTPIISGTVSAALANGEYLVVTVDGKTYTSETGGAVVVDPNNSTWYLQIPDSAALGINSYDVTAQVKSSAGNGNTTGIANGSLTVGTESINTSWASSAGVADNSTMTLGLNSSGLWNIIANGQSYSSSAISSYSDTALTNTRGANVVSQTSADFDRNGTADVFGTETSYAGSTQVMWTYNGSSYTASQLAVGTTIWYGGVMAYDKTGDGYVDLAYGDAGFDSKTYVVNNNGTLVADGTNGNGGFAGQFVTGREISGVDINNDGTVDIVQHTNLSGANSMTVINNNGNGTLSIGQNLTGVFVANAANTTNAASMTWADFNGDGYMDLYIGSSLNNTGGVIYYNDGNGQLSAAKSAVEASNATAGYLSVAVDWNGDGQMDVIKLSTYSASQTATLFTNNNHGSSWTTTQLASSLVNVTGIAALDYNWDGTQDLLISQRNGQVVYVQNNQAIADGTAMHLRIVDSEGINVYYGNTVNLYNAAGALVASQIINAQSGIGVNDSSALVSFYGLNPNETYSAEIVKITNGVSDNVTWDGLEAGNGKESYVLTAEAANGGNSGTITGTGYNDTFIAEEGTYTYNGSGGWNTTSDHDTWSSTGGMDVVDYRNATSGVTVDLSISTAQDTGFNTSRLVNIEGITGSDFDDVITGNSGDNLFEGRGGNDTFNIGSGGHDTLLYKLINAADATGGNGSDVVNGFTVGTWEGTADTDRIDLRELLTGSGYTGSGSASYVNGVAALDAGAGNLTDYIRVVQNGSNTEIQIDRDGSGGQFDPTTVVTLNGVQTDLATLLANHQLLVV